MAVTTADLAVELRLSVDGMDLDQAQEDVLERLRSVATRLVDTYANAAPDHIKDEAAIRVAGYLYDVAPGAINAPTNAMLYSGAEALLSPWRVQRAWIIGGSEPEDLSEDDE